MQLPIATLSSTRARGDRGDGGRHFGGLGLHRGGNRRTGAQDGSLLHERGPRAGDGSLRHGTGARLHHHGCRGRHEGRRENGVYHVHGVRRGDQVALDVSERVPKYLRAAAFTPLHGGDDRSTGRDAGNRKIV
jgi:hypothetical protein